MVTISHLRFPALVGMVVLALTGARIYTQEVVDAAASGLPNPFKTKIRNWGPLPGGREWGGTSTVAVGPRGELWAADRCGGNANCDGKENLPTIFRFDPSTGKLLKSFGEGMVVFPHGLYVDKDGNVWVTDGQANKAKTRGHQVIKFSPEGKVLLTLGKAGQAGAPPEMLYEPNAVITAPNGDIFVAEGHNGQNMKAPPDTVARLTKFTKDGKFIKSWGKLGEAPGEFRTPHALAFDSRGRLFVADRGNMRIQIFDQEGKFIDSWKQFSRVSGMVIDKNDMLYAIDSESNTAAPHPGWRKGVRIGSVKDGKVMFFIPPHEYNEVSPDDRERIRIRYGENQSAMGEGVAVDREGNVYVAEVAVWGLTKYVK